MGLSLTKLQTDNKQAKKMSLKELIEGQKNIDRVLHHQSLLYMVEIIHPQLVSYNHNDLRVNNFKTKTTREMIAQKYHQLIFCHNFETYVKDCDICLAFKIVCHKLYGELQLLLVLIHYLKDWLIDFLISLSISTN